MLHRMPHQTPLRILHLTLHLHQTRQHLPLSKLELTQQVQPMQRLLLTLLQNQIKQLQLMEHQLMLLQRILPLIKQNQLKRILPLQSQLTAQIPMQQTILQQKTQLNLQTIHLQIKMLQHLPTQLNKIQLIHLTLSPIKLLQIQLPPPKIRQHQFPQLRTLLLIPPRVCQIQLAALIM